MDNIRNAIAKYILFVFWICMALLALCALVCCATQAACGFGQFWAICGAVGSGIGMIIFGWQAYGEWLERNNY